MGMFWKRIAAIVLAGSFVFGIAGCSKSSSKKVESFDVDSFQKAAEKTLDWDDLIVLEDGFYPAHNEIGEIFKFDYDVMASKGYHGGEYVAVDFKDSESADECFKLYYDQYINQENAKGTYNKGESGYVYFSGAYMGFFAYYYNGESMIFIENPANSEPEEAFELLDAMNLPH